ncbi:LysR family transcriptional regulator [Parapusillimonas sp. SGNA-6]|nr:LysR family transcriptional regulator [Parapusillimonas sp. SGNA-6]
MLDSRLLNVFAVVAEELHFGRAAARLFMTQPPLSQSIKKLEETLNVQLLTRSTRSVRLTPAGLELQRRLVQMNKEMDLAVQAVQQVHRGESGRLTLGLTPSASYSTLSQRLYRFHERYPGVVLEFREMNSSDMPDALHKRNIDLALLRPPFADPDLAPEQVYTEPLVFAIRKDHPFAASGRRSLSLKEAMSFDLIGYARKTSRYFSQVFALLVAKSGMTPHIVQESMVPAILLSVESGMGAAIVPASLSRLRADTLAYLELDDLTDIRAELVAARHPANPNPAIANFLALMKAEASAMTDAAMVESTE